MFISGGSSSRWIASKTMKMEMRHRNSPLANPERVSTREYLHSTLVSVYSRGEPQSKLTRM